MPRLNSAWACSPEFAVPVEYREAAFYFTRNPFTSGKLAAIISKDICFEEECLGNAPQSEPKFGVSSAGRAHRESPPSSEPNIFDQ